MADTKAREAGRGWFDDNDENRLRRDARKSLEAALTRAGITADISALYSNISRKVEKGNGPVLRYFCCCQRVYFGY